ncbi:gem-associated protein 5-like [Saccostrea echinata]|uniref:gem-associated protein 5-like n=1 Tax=Saccostrea echinata TaxID=191078 RepID=UPI002A7F7A3B|nr:gem-associated protein 5-like [Saccostrea echinata]
MCDLILPPSPQWYCSKIIDYNKKGIVIFGTRHDVFVLDASSVPPTYVAQCCLHKERISSVALNENNICCSASEDGKVKVWKIDNPRDAIDEHNIHSSKIGCICWSSGNSPVVVSGDDRGQIVCWQYQENRTICYCPEAAAIVCLVCSNLNETQVAVGYRTGVVLIVDMREWKEGQVLQRLRGHDDEVLCLAWCPIPGENFKDYKDLDNPDISSLNGDTNGSTDFGSSGHLLVSSSRDKTVRVWSSARGRQILVFKPPKSAPAGREDKAKMWMTLLWNQHNANQIYASSFGGEILRWSLDSNSSQKPESLSSGKVLYHTRPVFCMCVGGSSNSMMCTVSMDRQMIFWDLSKSVPICAVPTLGGFVYVAKTSPIDPGRLAIGVGDSMIRLWNMNNVNNPFDVALLWQGIRSKVTALCWHPEKEGRLGFGTDDGRVGVFDTLSNKPPFVSSHYHRRTVYVVAWGPPCSEVENESSFVLYSVGDGIILSHDPKKFQNEAQDINSVIFKTNGPKPRVPIRSEISWNPDYSLVAIGNDDGSVEIYKPPLLKLLCVVHIHHKLVNSIQWHPVHNVDTTSSQRFYMAMGSNEATIQVVDLSSILGRVPENSDDVVLISEAKYTLFGHNNRIIGLQWSPHDENKLVSVSFDGSARVWEVSKGQTIASYHGHRGRLLCVQWSGSDPDVLFTGGEDFTLHKWRISKNPHSAEDDALRKKKTKSKGKKKIPRDDDKNSLEVIGSRQDNQNVKGSRQESEGEATGSSVTLDTETQASLDDLIQRKKAELEGPNYKPSEDSGVSVISEDISRENTELTVPIKQQGEISTISTSKIRENKDFLTKDVKKKRLSKPKSLFPLCGRHENRGKELVLQDIIVLTQSIYEKSKVEKSADDSDNSEEFDAEEHISLGFYLPDRRAILQCLRLED